MAFERLSAREQKIVLRCMRATAAHVAHSEKNARLRLEMSDLKGVIDYGRTLMTLTRTGMDISRSMAA
jgi:hypothetical protein